METFQHVLGVTILTVVFAELGCFFRTAALVDKLGCPAAVCLGTLIANVIIVLPILIGGEWLHRVLPPIAARVVSGLVLVLLGFLILIGREL